MGRQEKKASFIACKVRQVFFTCYLSEQNCSGADGEGQAVKAQLQPCWQYKQLYFLSSPEENERNYFKNLWVLRYGTQDMSVRAIQDLAEVPSAK